MEKISTFISVCFFYMSLFQCFESVGVNTGKFVLWSFPSLTLLIHELLVFEFFCGQASIVKNAKNEKKKKKQKDQKAKKPRFRCSRRFLIFTPSKPLKTFGDKLKVASSTCHFHLNQNGTFYRNSLDMCVIGFQSRRKFNNVL
jgi:hypothetical protein